MLVDTRELSLLRKLACMRRRRARVEVHSEIALVFRTPACFKESASNSVKRENLSAQ